MPLIPFSRLARFQTKLTHTILLLPLCLTASLARADLLDPLDFTPLGTFNVTNGGYIIDTDAVTISQTNGVSTNLLFTGVVDNQGGQADSFGPGTAVTNIGPLGIPHIAVFTFDDLVMDGAATFAVTGHRALALLSQGNAFINVALSLNGQTGVYGFAFLIQTNIEVAGGVGGVGGFAGGDSILKTNIGGSIQAIPLPQTGVGPGGGPAYYREITAAKAADGSFGSVGSANSTNATGTIYGDLTGLLQGGSGGGCACHNDGQIVQTFYYVTGSGGGGALEISAAGLLHIGSTAVLVANGSAAGSGQNTIPGAGSGGGIRLAGSLLLLDGSVAADSFGDGGGGRILLRGLTGQRFTSDLESISLDHLSVRSLAGTNLFQGVVHIESALGDVMAGDSYELGSVASQMATTNRPTVELRLRDIVVEGNITVPAGGITYPHTIELRGPVAQITGADPLALTAQLSGNGSVAAPLNVLTGGSILVSSGNELTFTQPVTNAAGASINNISGTLTFAGDGNGATDDGLVNRGTLNLINAVVNGDVRSPAGSTNNVAGSATFNGHFKGAASFSGTQNLVTFNGGYEPGDSPVAVSFGGSVAFGSGGTLTLELGGTSAGTHYDQLTATATATFGGTLNVVLIDSFVPAAGQVFQLFNAASRVGSFTTVNLPALGPGLSWDNQINANGSLAVVAAPGGGPQFGSVTRSGGDLIFSGTGGAANGDYVVLSSTNVAAPLLNWLPVTSNVFDASGNFIFTNPFNSTQQQEYYRLRLP
jgi:hypothetical protein